VSERKSVNAINGRIGAIESWARLTKAERRRRTEAGRAGLLAKFEREADPEGRMSEAERIEAAESLRRAHMMRLSMQAKRARATKKKQDQKPTSSAK
jgi:hypothetical protein